MLYVVLYMLYVVAHFYYYYFLFSFCFFLFCTCLPRGALIIFVQFFFIRLVFSPEWLTLACLVMIPTCPFPLSSSLLAAATTASNRS